MPTRAAAAPGSDSWQRQRVVRRSTMSVMLPVVLLSVLSANMIWAILVGNAAVLHLDRDPTLVLTDTNTAANLLALGIAYVIARSQWAKLYRPSIAFAIDDEGKMFAATSEIWRCWMSNAGPGGAVFVRYDWQIGFIDDGPDARLEWQPVADVIRSLSAKGPVDGTSFSIRDFGAGAVFPVTNRYDDGVQFAWFSVDTLALIRSLNVRVRVRDHIGDWHERRFGIMDKMPSVVRSRISQVRQS